MDAYSLPLIPSTDDANVHWQYFGGPARTLFSGHLWAASSTKPKTHAKALRKLVFLAASGILAERLRKFFGMPGQGAGHPKRCAWRSQFAKAKIVSPNGDRNISTKIMKYIG
ncbi:MAG: hypothetical protein ACKN9T_16785 [Candidatus Methylumidiphilus sp.]